MRRLGVFAIAAALLCGCGGEKLSPVSTGAADAGSDAAPAPSALTVKRTVMMQNPFGGPAGNQLVDGDFELSTVPQAGAQLGWRAFSSDGSTKLNIDTETGGLCRSGLRCALLGSGMLFFIRGTAAKGKGNVASIWARPPSGSSCATVRPLLVACDSTAVYSSLAHAAVGADGWCRYGGGLAEQTSSICLYVDNSLPMGSFAVLDAAVIGPDDGTVSPLSVEAWVPDGATMKALQNVQEYLRATTPLGKAAGPMRRHAAQP